MNKEMLTIGSRFVANQERFQVIGLRSGCLELRSDKGIVCLTPIAEVLQAPDYQMLLGSTVTTNFDPSEELTEEQETQVEEFECHILEMQTGYPLGKFDESEKPPKSEYDPTSTTLSQRVKRKAIELNRSERSLWQYHQEYRSRGIAGLLDGRSQKSTSPFSRTDQKVVDAVKFILEETRGKSTVTKKVLQGRVTRYLQQKQPNIKTPSEATLNRMIDQFSVQLGLQGTAKQQRNREGRPPTPFGTFHVTRPGELIILDSSGFNVFVLDPLKMKWVRIQITIAFDYFSRSIVAWRLTPTVKEVDAALLLYDILRPKIAGAGWHNATHRTYVGVPDQMQIWLPPLKENEHLAGIPAIYPENVLIDHGKVYISKAFKDACNTLGINVQLARRRGPTDKSPIETTFDYINENFCGNLPGYTGADINSRGVQIEKDSFYFLSELRDKFGEWVAGEWQRRHHEGIHVPELPELKMSPNDMYDLGLARAGFVYCIPNSTLYFELLPTKWLKVVDIGVTLNGLQYDHVALNNYRNVASHYGGRYPGRYPIRFDVRNLEEVFFYDYQATPAQWISLQWRHARKKSAPFSDNVLAEAKSTCIIRRIDVKDTDVFASVMNEILTLWDEQMTATATEKKNMIKNAMKIEAAQRDKPVLPATTILAASDAPIEFDLDTSEVEDDELIDLDYDDDEILESGDDYVRRPHFG